LNIDCFVDGGILSAKAILIAEEEKYKKELSALVAEYEYLTSDFIILLTATEEKINEYITGRARDSEMYAQALDRAIKIEDEFIRLSKASPHVLSIDRKAMDFGKYENLKNILQQIEQLR
jgi:deoxyadenosine/deoxycytidine kinase